MQKYHDEPKQYKGYLKSALRTETGQFQAMMDVELVNDGPVTLLLESRRALAARGRSTDS